MTPVIAPISSTGPCATPPTGSSACCEPSTTLNSMKLLWPMLYATGDDFESGGKMERCNRPWINNNKKNPKQTKTPPQSLKRKIFAARFYPVQGG